MVFEDVLKQYFPVVYREYEYVDMTYAKLLKQGFDENNSISCVSVCRDERTQPFVNFIRKRWGEAFNFASLGGMLFLGKTGFIAAQHHAPNIDGRERYIYFAFPHISIGEGGEVGLCLRAGRKGGSCACGALAGFLAELKSGKLSLRLDFDDLEQSLIKMKLVEKLAYDCRVPDLLSLTRLTLSVIQEDLKRLIDLTVDTQKNDYAVLSGILIHGPEDNYVWPDTAFFVKNGETNAL